MPYINQPTIFNEEPKEQCPLCHDEARAIFVDNGFGPYSVQAGPYECTTCNWVEDGCKQDVCIKEKCISWEVCRGGQIEKTRH